MTKKYGPKKTQRPVASSPFTDAEVDELTGLLGEYIDAAFDRSGVVGQWLQAQAKPMSVDAYQDLVETILDRAMGQTLSLFEDKEFIKVWYDQASGLAPKPERDRAD
jgi:hypothetical protein